MESTRFIEADIGHIEKALLSEFSSTIEIKCRLINGPECAMSLVFLVLGFEVLVLGHLIFEEMR